MFDAVANSYDQSFTFSAVGQSLRKIVHDYLSSVLPVNEKIQILELNCGTGEDALFFGNMGHRVFATDISEAMIEVTKQKVQHAGLENNVTSLVCDINNLDCDLDENSFDFVFSNFGGLNCINAEELRHFADNLHRLLKPGGRFIAVVMPSFCLWESFYFLFKMNFRNVFRRNTRNPLDVKVGDAIVKTWYHSPSGFMACFYQHFQKLGMKPVGISLPPSYLNDYFEKHPKALNTLDRIEHKIKDISFLANFSDHYLIDMQKI